MDLPELCCLFLMIALVAGCGGCLRKADGEPGSAAGLFPEPLPTPPAVPEPWVLPTVPALSRDLGGFSSGSQTSHSIAPLRAVMEDDIHG
jgi:hypothetical protein